ncbi:MAG: type II toxin-antitoxin system CcdA family antitoxin [Pseudomonadota bacterium]
MPTELYDTKATKKAVNLRVNGDLLRQAKALNINLSKALEQQLAELAREARTRQWLAENKSAIDDYNARIEKQGVFSDGLRRF